jgi:hypothetical protein
VSSFDFLVAAYRLIGWSTLSDSDQGSFWFVPYTLELEA